MIQSVAPFVTLTGGRAREAAEFWADAFPEADLLAMNLVGPGEDQPEGNVRLAIVKIGITRLRIIDAPQEEGFDLSAGLSIFIEVSDAADVDEIHGKLTEGGQALMPPDTYPFAERFTWVVDRFGVNWQIIHGGTLE
jgi:predicted 3-demethylubiquinone-9 3-methyltransferase (glyoxalase superfamily)